MPLCRLMPSVSGVTHCATRRQATAIRGFNGPPSTPINIGRASRNRTRRTRSSRPPVAAISFVLSGRPDRHTAISKAGWRRSANARWWRSPFANTRSLPRRNSNLTAWGKLAEYLTDEGFAPIFVPDTATAFDPVDDAIAKFPIFTEGAMSVELRMALYETAWLNMLVNNGPFGCLSFSDSPYLMFKILTPGVRMTSESYMTSLGYEIGATPPFCSPFQKWVWRTTTCPYSFANSKGCGPNWKPAISVPHFPDTARVARRP